MTAWMAVELLEEYAEYERARARWRFYLGLIISCFFGGWLALQLF